MNSMAQQNKSDRIDEIWQRAQRHRLASQVGTASINGDYELCSCCDQVVQKEPIPLCEHTKELEKYGFGYPLWFSYLKYCIILMLMLIASKTANELYMGATENWEFCYGQDAVATVQSQNHESSIEQNKSIHQNSLNHDLYPQLKQQLGPTTLPIASTSVIEPSQSKAINNLNAASPNPQIHQPKCTSFMVFLSIFKGQKMFQNYFLKSVEFFVHLIALIAVRNMILKEEQYYDQRTTLISKYSIIIHNLPNVHSLKRKVRNLFQQQFGCMYGNSDSEIRDMIFVFKDERLTKLNQQKQHLEEEIISAQAQQDEKRQVQLQEKLQQVENQLHLKTQESRRKIDNDLVKCNKMIVIMRTEGDKASVLYSFKQAIKQGKNFNEYFYDVEQMGDKVPFKPTQILMKEAPQPNEIIWEHLDESDGERKWLIVQGYVFTFLFLAVITVVFYFIMLAKTSLFLQALEMEENDPHNFKVESFKSFATFIVFVALFGVVLFNKFIMGNVIHKFVHMERHAYTDKENHSFALKYALGMFFTTALMTLAVEALTYNNFYSHPYGVIEQETIMFFVTAFIIPLIWWIHPYNLMKSFHRKKIQGKLMTQRQANQLVEYFPYMLGKRYAEVFEIIWFTFLYSELIPLGSFLMLVGLMLYYWVDKYNFLRKSAIKERVSGKMAILGLKSLDATLFLSPAGELLFAGILRNQFDYPALIFTLIGVVYTLLPVTSFIWELNGEKFLIQEKTYEESIKKFKDTYHSLHPIYKLTHRNEVEKHREMFQEFQKEDLKKIKHYGTGRGNYRPGTTTTKASRLNTDIDIDKLKL